MLRALRWLGLTAVLACVSCSDSSSRPPGDETGTVVFRIAWPAIAGRLVPDRARSLTVRVTRSGGELLGAETTSRPSGVAVATLTFVLPAGEPLTATANVYPEADGTGESLASAAMAINVPAGETLTIDISGETDRLRSTVDTFTIEPNPAQVAVGSQVTLTATARHGSQVVLLPRVTFEITAGGGNLGFASGGNAGWQTAEVVGLAEGTATVTARVEQQAGRPDTELVATATVHVGPVAPPPSDNGVLSGRVFDQDGAPIDGVALSLVGTSATATTNLDGYFSFGELAPGAVVVRAEHDGYVSQTRPATVVAARNNRIHLQLREVGVTQAIDPSVDNTVSHAGGSVFLPAGSVVLPSGRQAAGTVLVTLTVLRPSDDDYVGSFPGEFRGVQAGNGQGQRDLLQSFGVVDVTITDGGGTVLELADGAQAQVSWPIVAGADPGDATVPIWSLDPNTGIWQEEGFAVHDTVRGVYRGSVEHFSPWNLDRPFSALAAKDVRITVDGDPAEGVPVRVAGRGWAFDGVTDETGRATIAVPADETADVLYLDRDNVWQVAEAGERMPGAGQVLVNEFAFPADSGLDPNQLTILLRWGERPEDLDSNLLVPPFGPRTGYFQVWYAERGQLHLDPYARLDTDDTTGFGPEIISVRQLVPGTYRYVVHRFSDDGTLEASQAEVVLLRDNGAMWTFRPPASNPNAAEYWGVFEVVVNDLLQVADVRELAQYGGAELLLGGTSRSRK